MGSQLVRLERSHLVELEAIATAQWFHAVVMKRDDRLALEGNKSRKLYALHTVLQRMVEAQSPRPSVLSWGGNQSNAMLALAQLCSHHNVPFHYITHAVPRAASQGSHSNWTHARMLGMHAWIEPTWMPSHPHRQAVLPPTLQHLVTEQGGPLLSVPQGASGWWSASGVQMLVQELETELPQAASVSDWYLLVPAGTGTTALWLHLHALARNLPWAIVAVPAAGTAAQLQAALHNQLAELRSNRTSADASPQCSPLIQRLRPDVSAVQAQIHLGWPQPGTLGILAPPKKYSRLFARCHQDFTSWQEAVERVTGITMDLVYAPKAWITLEAHVAALAKPPLDTHAFRVGLCVVHTGGTSGNASMRARRQDVLRNG